MAHNRTLSRSRQRRRITVAPSQANEVNRSSCTPSRILPHVKKCGRSQSLSCVKKSSDELLRPAQAAMLLNVTPRCLQDWRLKGTGPRFIRMTPKLVQYRRSDLEKFIEERAAPTERTSGERSEPSRRGCELRSQQGVSEPRI